MQDQLKDFLDKKDKNQLLIQKATNLLKTLLRPVCCIMSNILASDGSCGINPGRAL